jgi:predicted phosphodiesterase
VLALLYDVHGNLPALEAVLGDARAQGAERYLLGGDYALFGGWPNETVARLRTLEPATWIRGNGERWTASPADAPEHVQGAIAVARDLLGDEVVAALGALPEQSAQGDTLFCHGSPVSDVRSFFPEPGDDEAELLEGVTALRLVFGHTHLAFKRAAGDVELVNPGSVGMPLDGDPHAAYAIVRHDGSVEHRRATYDHAASAARIREVAGGADWGDWAAQRVETASAG